jgi:hypothetical protein
MIDIDIKTWSNGIQCHFTTFNYDMISFDEEFKK